MSDSLQPPTTETKMATYFAKIELEDSPAAESISVQIWDRHTTEHQQRHVALVEFAPGKYGVTVKLNGGEPNSVVFRVLKNGQPSEGSTGTPLRKAVQLPQDYQLRGMKDLEPNTIFKMTRVLKKLDSFYIQHFYPLVYLVSMTNMHITPNSLTIVGKAHKTLRQGQLPSSWQGLNITYVRDPEVNAFGAIFDMTDKICHGMRISKVEVPPLSVEMAKMIHKLHGRIVEKFPPPGHTCVITLLTGVKMDDRDESSLVILATDWELAEQIEKWLGAFPRFEGYPVYVVRETVVWCDSHLEEYTECLLPGTRGGGQSMTMGAIFRRVGSLEMFMLQCNHGYLPLTELNGLMHDNQVCYAPPPGAIDQALGTVDTLKEKSEREDDTEAIRRFEEAKRILTEVKNSTRSVEIVVPTVDNPNATKTVKVYDPQVAAPLRLGEVYQSSDEADAVFIRLDLSQKLGVAKHFANPVNSIFIEDAGEPGIRTRASNLLPRRFIGVSRLTNSEMIARYCQEDELRYPDRKGRWLGKIGTTTGLTKFRTEARQQKTHPEVTDFVLVRPLKGEMEAIQDPGDSSAACFDNEGRFMGHMALKFESTGWAGLVPWRHTQAVFKRKHDTEYELVIEGPEVPEEPVPVVEEVEVAMDIQNR